MNGIARAFVPRIGPMAGLVGLSSILLTATPASAQDESPPIEPAPRFEATLMAGMWVPRLGGKAALGANSGQPDLRFEEEYSLGNSEIIPNAELTLRFDDRWFVRGTGFEFSTSTRNNFIGNATFGTLTLNDGDAFSARIDMLSVSLEVGVDVYRPLPDRRRREIAPTSLRVSAVAGARYLGVDQDVATAAGFESGSGNWVALYGGADFQLRFAADFRRPAGRGLVLDAGAGGGVDVVKGGPFTYIRASLTLEVTDHIGVFFGYRLLEVNFDDPPYGFDAGLQGLFVGGSLRF